jgi:hypothetical protein
VQMTYVLIKDHLEQAQAILRGRDDESTKLREVLQMVIGLIDDLQVVKQRRSAKIISFPGRENPPRSGRD